MKNRALPRLFIGPREIAGYYCNLASGFDQLGLPVTLVGATLHAYGYKARPHSAWPARFYEYAAGHLHTARHAVSRLVYRALTLLARLLLLAWAIPRHDVFIFGAGISLLPLSLDLPLLRWLGKMTICYVGHGSESRPPYLDGALRAPDGQPPPLEFYRAHTAAMVRRLSRIEKSATFVICSPLSAHFLQKPFINSFAFGSPFSLEITPPSAPPPARRSTRILHAPSHRAAKGSDFIAAIIKDLTAKGHLIEYVELHGVSHSVVLEEIQKSDFLIDQAYSDYPLAGLATEAAYFGKPAIVGGYAWTELRRFFPPDNWPPSHQCLPDEMEAAIEEWIIFPARRHQAGEAIQAFVRAKWTNARLAEKYLHLIREDFPKDWWLSPAATPFTPGGFAEFSTHRDVIRRLVDTHGVAALCLDDKPALRQAVLQFATVNAGPAPPA